MRAWWVSWYSHRPLGEFELHSPWWVSGYDADDNDICVAAVLAESEADAYAQIRNAYDAPRSDGDIEERFCDELTVSPFNDRFPQGEWMVWDPETLTTCHCGAHDHPMEGERESGYTRSPEADLGRAYLDRATRSRELAPEDQDLLRGLLGLEDDEVAPAPRVGLTDGQGQHTSS